MLFIHNKEPTVSLYQKNINWILLSKLLKWNLLVITIIASYNVFLSFSFFNVLNCFIWASSWKLAEKLEAWCLSRFKYRQLLRYFLESNKLFTEDSLDGKNYISTSAIIGWKERDNKLIIKAFKKGDSYSRRLENLDTELSALLNLPLETKIIRPSIVEYHFYTVRPTRFQTSMLSMKPTNPLSIDLGYGVVYNPVECPHILIAGGTGSGKSILISYFILEILKRHSVLFIADPKNSDLGSLSHYLGSEKVATTPNHIARIVRLTVQEMNRRYEYMRENFRYGANFSDHGFKTAWLIFDEMGAFQASGTDKKSKEIIQEVMDGIKQIILLGRQAGVFILVSAQQVNADTLNTDLRDNLGLRIALGANSSEGYRMVFGSATPVKQQPLEVKGAGYLYMQGSGKDSAEYWESPYLNPKEFDFISELQKLIH
ncbi:TPA: otitis media-associated H10 [Streptococcus suis]|nr:otitis media-associated H10 [Streptococcus suis]HEL2396784.1 otitis media-associated H10 [Streptococcus suis]HEL9618504.1 otitis media-associated H10 [Streptococcus suis]HEL9649694.1 otitis media-associated H10 [Streptococcus suis]